MLDVMESTVWNWENQWSTPPVSKCKPLIDFLGYDPFPQPETFAEELIVFRRRNGLRVKDAAKMAKVDPCSWSSWERDEHRITKSYRARILALIAE